MGNCRKSGRAYNFQGKEISYKLMTPFVTVRTRLESLCNQCFLPPSCLNFFPKFLLGILLPTVFLNLFSFFNPYLASPTPRLLVWFESVSIFGSFRTSWNHTYFTWDRDICHIFCGTQEQCWDWMRVFSGGEILYRWGKTYLLGP